MEGICFNSTNQLEFIVVLNEMCCHRKSVDEWVPGIRFAVSLSGPFTVPVDEEVESQHMKFIQTPPGKPVKTL